MNAAFAMLNHPLMRQVGWVLLHSLWQGALIGVVFVVLRVALRRCSANMRYLGSCLCLALLVATPVLTLIIGPTPSSASGPGASVESATAGAAASVLSAASLGRSHVGNGTDWPLQGGAGFFTRLAPLLATLWLLGVTFFSARLTKSCWWVRNIRLRDNEPLEVGWKETLDDLRCRLGVSRPVRLLKSALVEVPAVIGWLRPVILVPAATLSGLTPRELEAILAHELAHVRRHDYLVNALQCLVETLMFYHPVAWWISRCIRDERENCCDDLVIRVCGDRLGYARALATLEGLRAELPELAFAASGGSLLNRIRRLLGVSSDDGPATAGQVGGVVLLGIGLLLIVLGVSLAVAPRAYWATARIKIEPDLSEITGSAAQRGMIAYDPYLIQTEFELLQSEAVLGKVIEALDLNKEWSKRYAGGDRLKTSETMTLLRSKLDLRPVRNTSLVEIRVVSDEHDEAAKIANAVAEAYIAHWKGRRSQMSRDGIKALEERFAEQAEKVRKAQREVDKLRVDLGISEVAASADGPGPLLSADTLRKLESLRIESKAEYVRQATLLERLKSLEKEIGTEGLASAITTAVPDALLGSLQEQVNLAGGRLAALEKEYGDGHVEVIKCKAVLADLGDRVKSRVKGIMLGLDARVQSLSNSLDNLDKEIESATRNDNDRANQSAPYFEAKRALEELQRFRQILNMKIASEKIDVELPKTAMVEIVDRAVPALRSVSPNVRGALALIALGISLDLSGLVMLKGRPGAGSAPRPA